MSNKPTFVFVHGAWHNGDCWGPLRQALEAHQYRSISPDLPGVLRYTGAKPGDLQIDVDLIRKSIMTELDEGRNVILVCHSWGGVPSASALRDLDSEARKANGFHTSVVALAAITSFIILEGQNIQNSKGPFTKTDKSVGRVEGELVLIGDPGPIPTFYHDLPSEESQKWAATLHPHSLASIGGTCTYSPYGKIATHYLICMQDKAIMEGLQRHYVQQIRDQGWDVRTEEVDAGHSPFLSQVEKTLDFLMRCAGESISESESVNRAGM